MNRQSQHTLKEHVYVDGNTVRKAQQRPARQGVRVVERDARAARRRERHIRRVNRAYFAFLTASALLVSGMLAWYIFAQSAITESVKNIAVLERELNALKRSNDEAYARAASGVDLEEVKRIAIEELGMQYAKEGQIVTYAADGSSDYVRQLQEIPSTQGD